MLTTLSVIAAAAHSYNYQETRLEDVVGEYEFSKFKEMIVNTSKLLIQAVGRLETNAAKEASLSRLEESVQEMEDSISTLTEHTIRVNIFYPLCLMILSYGGKTAAFFPILALQYSNLIP